MEEIMRNRTKTKGLLGETMALEFLVGKGWSVVARNWRSRRGVIDILACDPGDGGDPTLVAVEVKSWWAPSWDADELRYAIPPYKRIKIHRSFSDFLACHPQLEYHSFRIDAICIRQGRVSHFQGV